MLIQSRRASLERSGLCLRWFVLSWRVIRWAQLIRDRSTRGSFLSKIDMRILKKVFVCINIRSIGFNKANVGIPVPTFLPWSCSPLLTSEKMKQFSYFINFPIALLFLVITLIDPSLALCNGADAIMCCLNTGPASDPLIALQLLLSGVKAPAQDTVIGVGCTPITNTVSTWYVSICKLRVSPT